MLPCHGILFGFCGNPANSGRKIRTRGRRTRRRPRLELKRPQALSCSSCVFRQFEAPANARALMCAYNNGEATRNTALTNPPNSPGRQSSMLTGWLTA